MSVSFVPVTLLAFRTYNFLVRAYYTAAAVWLGILNFLFVASSLCWIAYPLVKLSGLPVTRPTILAALYGLALLAAVCAILIAAWPRVTRVSVKLPGLPDSWRGRVAALLSDTHLGHIRGRRFAARVAAKLKTLRPDIVFFPGDMFDGTKLDAARVAAPWKSVAAPLGAYFVTGNHEEFFDPAKFVDAVAHSGIRVLENEKVVVDGLQIVGVGYGDSGHPDRFAAILESAAVDRTRASILLAHVPRHLALAENHGISLQLSGHTHGGQIFPFTLFVSRIFGKYAHGLQRFGGMAVYTSYGAGTWGPPMRLGTWPEIVLIRFD